MQSKRKILDQGTIAGGLQWEVSGISPACGFELQAIWGDIKRVGFMVHPLQLVTAAKRQQLAIELLLPAVAKQLTGDVLSLDAAASQLKALPDDDQHSAAKTLATSWLSLRNQARQEAAR